MSKFEQIIQKLNGYVAIPAGQFSSPLSDGELEEVQAQLGIVLPEDYAEFLRYHGGIGFDQVAFPFENDDSIDGGSVDFFHNARSLVELEMYGRSQQQPFPVDLVPSITLVKQLPSGTTEFEWPGELLVIACDAGGNQICLALGGLRPGSIFLWMGCQNYGDQNLYLMADSLSEFLSLLYIWE